MALRIPTLASLLSLAACLAAPLPAAAALHAGDPAPDFRGTDLDGVSRKLSDYRGKVVILFVLGST